MRRIGCVAMVVLLLPIGLLAQADSGNTALEVANYFEVGNSAFEAGNYREAALAYERVEDETYSLILNNRIGISYHFTDRLKDAEDAYKLAIRADRRAVPPYNNLGALYYSRRRFKDAEKQFVRALERNRQSAVVRDNLQAAQQARNEKGIESLIATLSTSNRLLLEGQESDLIRVVLLIHPDELEKARRSGDRGDSLLEQEMYSEAIAEYQNAAAIHRYDTEMLNRLGFAYHLSSRLAEAEKVYQSAVRLDEEYGPPHNNLGALYYGLARFSDARKQFVEALERDPDNLLMRRNLRAAQYARRSKREIRAALPAVRREHPGLIQRTQSDLIEVVFLMPHERAEQATQHAKRGDSFLARKMFEDAVIEYRKAIAIDPYNASIVSRLGISYHQQQRLDEAARQYRNVLKMNPYYLEAVSNLGSIEYVRGRYDRAISYYNEAMEIRPGSAGVLQNIGSCLFAMERYREGFQAYRLALETDPGLFDRSSGTATLILPPQRNEALVNFYMAKVFVVTGDNDRAISYLYKAVEEGFTDLDMLRGDSAFSVLSGDERFGQLLASLGAPS